MRLKRNLLGKINSLWKYNVAECFKRNSHNVPLTSIENMWSRWETTESCLAKIGDNNEFSS